MRPTRTIVTLSLVFLIIVAFAALVQKQRNDSPANITLDGSHEPPAFNRNTYSLLTFPDSTNFLSSFFAYAVPSANIAETTAAMPDNSTRTEIYEFIQANPGVQFRGICNELGLSIGLAQFHLGVLTKAGLVSFFRDGKYKRFFESKRFSLRQMRIIALLRHDTARDILRVMLEKKQISHSELAHEVSITSQGLTWQINRLQKEGLIQEVKERTRIEYSLNSTSMPILTETTNLINQN
jgi:predicted transcriptional regulator